MQPAMPLLLSNCPRLGCDQPLSSLLSAAAKYMRKGLSQNTLKAYDSAWWFFSAFCARFACPPLPVNIPLVCAFMVHSFESRKLQPLSIKALLAGIQFHLRCQDATVCSLFQNPSIRLLLNGLKKEQLPGNDKRLPLTITLVQSMVSKLRSGLFTPLINKMLEAVLLMAFYGFMRCGEFTTRSLAFNPMHDLCFSDLQLESDHYTIFLKHSKTDRMHKGTPVIIAKNNSVFCPFDSMLRFLRSRPAPAPSDPLFVVDGKPMTRTWFSARLRELCSSCGLNPDVYTAHSLRIGAATTAALLVPTSSLKSLGRWSSAAYVRYIRFSKNEILQAQKLMSANAV